MTDSGQVHDPFAGQFRPAEREQVQDRASPGQALADPLQEQKVLGAGQDEPPRPVLAISDALDVGEQGGDSLDFIQDHLARELPQEPPGVLHGEGPLVGVFK
jgi:hypothetical protein